MKKFFGMLAFVAIASMCASCNEEKKTEVAPAPAPVKEEVYQPQHNAQAVDLKAAKKYNYFNAPTGSPAASVVVNYNEKTPYAAPIEVKFSYANGDSFTYTVPATFGLWKNQAGKFRVISDNECKVRRKTASSTNSYSMVTRNTTAPRLNRIHIATSRPERLNIANSSLSRPKLTKSPAVYQQGFFCICS